jgi:hypothetical protein
VLHLAAAEQDDDLDLAGRAARAENDQGGGRRPALTEEIA